jgi:flagellar motility protein MotE (MotC chaperone)
MNFLIRKNGPRLFRLLPAVVLLGAAVLVTKGNVLIREAYAQASEKVAGFAADPVPANADYAGGEDDQVASANQVDVIGALARRRKELDARETVLNNQANMITAAESRVDDKIAQLKTLQTQIATLLGQRDQGQKDQIAALVKTYKTMPPKKAAPIFQTLPDEVAIPVAQGMSAADLAAIMQFMTPDAAQKLTVKLADRLALPKTTEAPAPIVPDDAGPLAAAAAKAADKTADKAADKPTAPKS